MPRHVKYTDNGTLFVTGKNDVGQLGLGHKNNIVKFEPSLLKVPVVVVSCGYYHTVVVREDATLWVTGNNYNGQLGLGSDAPKNVLSFVPVPGIEDVRGVSCGSYHTAVVRGDDRSLLVAGYNYYGQLGLGGDAPGRVLSFVPVPEIEDVREMGCGMHHTAVVRGFGSLLVAGRNKYGQLGLGQGAPKKVLSFVPVPGIEDVRGVGCGEYQTVVVQGDDRSLWVAGFNGCGWLGLGQGAPREVLSFVPVPGIDNVRGVGCDECHTVVVRVDGTLWVAGWNGYGQLGLGHTDNVHKFVPVPGIEGVRGVSCRKFQTVVMRGNGSLWVAGYNDNEQGQLGHTNVSKFVPVPGIEDVRGMGCGMHHMVAMTRICPHCGKTGKKTKLPLTTIMEFVCVVNKDDYTKTSSISVLPIELMKIILVIYNSLCDNCYKNY